MATRIKIRRGTSQSWITANPILAVGEMGYETDFKRFKIGDGTTPWTALTYSTGPQGDPGLDGKTVLSGSGTPSQSLGSNGDFYINIDLNNYSIYGPKTNNLWGNPISLIGPQGVKGDTGLTGPQGIQGLQGPTGEKGDQGIQGLQGTKGDKGDTGDSGADGQDGSNGIDGRTILNGTNSPNNSLGSNGDFYLDTTNNLLFGPKASDTWPLTGVSLIGPQGPKGDTGATGAQGIQGPKGDTGLTGPQGTGLSLKGTVSTSNALPSSGNSAGDGYLVQDTGFLWVWDGSAWVSIGNIVGPEGPSGIVNATSPLSYVSTSKTISLSYGSGLTLQNNILIPDFGTPGTSAVGATANTGTSITIARADHVHAREGFGTPGTSAVGATANTGTAVTIARSDHQHAREGFHTTPSTQAIGDTAAAGTSTLVSRGDHKHAMPSFGAPGTSAVGATANTGTAVTIARSDHQHARENFGTTIISGTEFNVASSIGTAVTISRSDHSHGSPFLFGGEGINVSGGTVSTRLGSGLTFSNSLIIPNFGTPVSSSVGDSLSSGISNTLSRADHVHAREGFGTPGTSAVGATANTGTAVTIARSDHQHARENFGTVVASSSFSLSSSNGVASTVSRSDHTHGSPTLSAGNGINTTGGTVSVQLNSTNPGLSLTTSGLAVDFGNTVSQVASGAHTHNNFVSTATTINTTSPLNIAGGTSANLSTNRTISINTFAGSGNPGVVNSTVNDVGKYLKADGTWDSPAGGSSKQESVGLINNTSGQIIYNYNTANVFLHSTSLIGDFVPRFTNVPTTNGFATTFNIIVPQGNPSYKINPGKNAQFTINVSSFGSGDSYTLLINGVATSSITQNNHAAASGTSGALLTALDSSLGAGNYVVSAYNVSATTTYTITMAEALFYENVSIAVGTTTGCSVTVTQNSPGVPALQVNSDKVDVYWTLGELPTPESGPVNEVQAILIENFSSTDTYRIFFDGKISSNITVGSHASSESTLGSVRYALNEVLGSGNWSIPTTITSSGYNIAFQGALANRSIGLNRLTFFPVGCTITPSILTPGFSQTDIWTFTLIRSSDKWTAYGNMSPSHGFI